MGLQRSDDDLEKAAGHIGYEWAMLRGSRDTDWQELPSKPRSSVCVANSFSRTEIILLHTRTLYEFFFGKKDPKHPDNIRATHFLEGTEAKEWETQLCELPGELCPIIYRHHRRLNKRLFHLSYDRETSEEGWDPDVAIRELEKAFRHFRNKLTESRRRLFDTGIKSRSDGPFPFLR